MTRVKFVEDVANKLYLSVYLQTWSAAACSARYGRKSGGNDDDDISPPPALARTKAVVASCVVFVASAAVGAVGVPVSAGEARAALASRAV